VEAGLTIWKVVVGDLHSGTKGGRREITEDPKDMLLYHRDMPKKIIPDYLHKKKKHTGILQSLNLEFHPQYMTFRKYLQEKH